MKRALELGRKGYDKGEIPVGAVIVKDGVIVGEGINERQSKGLATAHAEIMAIENACKALGDWRLDGCTIYVTLEPCPMCAGAIIMSRISEVVFGAYEQRSGAIDSVINLCDYPFENKPTVYGGICEDECLQLLKNFFAQKRNSEK